MSCLECPLQAICDMHQEIDAIEDAIAYRQVEEELEAAREHGRRGQDYFDVMLINALSVDEAAAAVSLSNAVQIASQLHEEVAQRGFAHVEAFAKARNAVRDEEQQLCLGPDVKRQFMFFGKVMTTACGSAHRVKRLGEPL